MNTVHLNEDERQSFADGTMPAERLAGAEAHLRECDQCAADVLRLSRLVTRAREAATPHPVADPDLWPSIRNRIEQKKVIALGSSAVQARAGRTRLAWTTGLAASLAAAAFIIMMTRDNSNATSVEDALSGGDGISLVAAADSANAYEEEAQALLDNLELSKARLRPDAAAAFDHDLRTVDSAIVELKSAITKDPSNRALRQLLASSYRQKVELLKRLSNAG
jgi:anti-sigma factor RsiW